MPFVKGKDACSIAIDDIHRKCPHAAKERTPIQHGTRISICANNEKYANQSIVSHDRNTVDSGGYSYKQ